MTELKTDTADVELANSIVEVVPSTTQDSPTGEARTGWQAAGMWWRKLVPFLIKILIFWIIYILLHFAYDWWPNPFMAAISGTNESFIQHAKIGFFAYAVVALVEALLHINTPRCSCAPFQRKLRLANWNENWNGKITARLFTLLLQPWVMFVVWYIVPIFFGRIPTDAGEAIWSNIALLVMIAMLLRFENEFESLHFSISTIIVLAFLDIVECAQLIVVSFKLPWADFFRDVTAPSSQQ